MFLKPLNGHTCTVPVCSIKDLPSTAGSAALSHFSRTGAACGYSCVAPGLWERSSGADNYFQQYSWCGWFMVGWNQQHEMRVVTELFFMIRWWHVSFCWLMTFTGLGHLRNRKLCSQPPVRQFLWGDLKTCNLCLRGSSCALGKLKMVFVA